MSKRPEMVSTAIVMHKPTLSCSCGCGSHHIHTKGTNFSKAEKWIVESRFAALHNLNILHNFVIIFIITFFPLGEKELVEFLTEEILAEKKAQKVQTIPTELNGFKVKLDAAEVELVKQNGSEK